MQDHQLITKMDKIWNNYLVVSCWTQKLWLQPDLYCLIALRVRTVRNNLIFHKTDYCFAIFYCLLYKKNILKARNVNFFLRTNWIQQMSLIDWVFSSTLLCKDISQLLDSIFVGREKNRKKAFEIDGRVRAVIISDTRT